MNMRIDDGIEVSAVRYVAIATRVGPDFVTVDDHHAEIHAGRTFVHNNNHTGVAAGASYWHVLTTGASPCALIAYHVTSDVAPVWIAVSEAPSFSGGTSAAFVNRNRRSAITPISVLVEGATVTDAGVHMEGDYATGTKQTGGTGGVTEVWPLAANTSYAFLVRNDATGAADLSFHLEISEVPA